MKREQEGEILRCLAVGAKNKRKFKIALYYINLALKKEPNEKKHKQLQNLKADIERRKEQNSRSSHDVKFEADKLLGKVSACVNTNDIDKAEFFSYINNIIHWLILVNFSF